MCARERSATRPERGLGHAAPTPPPLRVRRVESTPAVEGHVIVDHMTLPGAALAVRGRASAAVAPEHLRRDGDGVVATSAAERSLVRTPPPVPVMAKAASRDLVEDRDFPSMTCDRYIP